MSPGWSLPIRPAGTRPPCRDASTIRTAVDATPGGDAAFSLRQMASAPSHDSALQCREAYCDSDPCGPQKSGALAEGAARPELAAFGAAPRPPRITRLNGCDGPEQHSRTDQHHGEDVPGSWRYDPVLAFNGFGHVHLPSRGGTASMPCRTAKQLTWISNSNL